LQKHVRGLSTDGEGNMHRVLFGKSGGERNVKGTAEGHVLIDEKKASISYDSGGRGIFRRKGEKGGAEIKEGGGG